MVQSLQLKGREFDFMHVLVSFFFLFFVFLPLFDSFNFIYYRCTTTSEQFPLDHLFKRLMRNAYTEPVCMEHLRASK